MKIKKYLLSIVLILCSDINAQEHIALDLTGMTREAGANQLIEQLGYSSLINLNSIDTSYFEDIKCKSVSLMNEWEIMKGVGNHYFNPTQLITEEQNTIINLRLDQMINREIDWKHAFYAISSSTQMELIKNLNAVSFGWAKLEIDESGAFVINTDASNQNDFRIPTGFYQPLDFAKIHDVETYLMVFYEEQDDKIKELFLDAQKRKELVEKLVSLTNGITKDGETRQFDGLTIDFENFISEQLREPYITFLVELHNNLEKEGKKLNVAVQPETYFKGYNYKEIAHLADKIILMAHDYASKRMTPLNQSIGDTYTPLAPINQVYDDVRSLLTGDDAIEEKDKLVLQISFGSIQWQEKDGKVLNNYAYTPTYHKIEERLENEYTLIKFDNYSGNAFAEYTENGITNTIWYENLESINLKENLIRFLDLGGVSYWRLGNIPKVLEEQMRSVQTY